MVLMVGRMPTETFFLTNAASKLDWMASSEMMRTIEKKKEWRWDNGSRFIANSLIWLYLLNSLACCISDIINFDISNGGIMKEYRHRGVRGNRKIIGHSCNDWSKNTVRIGRTLSSGNTASS
jgi:hypothetical protein